MNVRGTENRHHTTEVTVSHARREGATAKIDDVHSRFVGVQLNQDVLCLDVSVKDAL